MAHFSIGTEDHGALNVQGGEYDAAFYFMITLGFPVWISYRGCFHVIQPVPTLSGIRRFDDRLAALAPVLPFRHSDPNLLIPLKDLSALRWMARAYVVLVVLALLGAIGLMMTFVVATMARPRQRMDDILLESGWASIAVFIPCLFLYQRRKKPSERQEAIRGAIKEWMGAATDPAEWHRDFASAVMQLQSPESGDPLGNTALVRAQELFASSRYAEACGWARMAMAMDWTEVVTAAAEEFTDKCLKKMGRA
jgi:hypothetical protein